MLKLLMIQNEIFSNFINYQLSCSGDFEHTLIVKPSECKWNLSLDQLKLIGSEYTHGYRNTISNKEVVREFLWILKRENVSYSINSMDKGGWREVKIIVKKGGEL